MKRSILVIGAAAISSVIATAAPVRHGSPRLRNTSNQANDHAEFRMRAATGAR